MPTCSPHGQAVRKNYAGDPFVVGDTLHCPFCGALITIDHVEPDGTSKMAPHVYPTKAEKRAMTRDRHKRA